MNLNPFKALSSYCANRANKSEEKKRQELLIKATRQSKKDYNIDRINDVDYITYIGVPISLPEDSKAVSMCDRLEIYRQNYVKTCMAKNKVVGID